MNLAIASIMIGIFLLAEPATAKRRKKSKPPKVENSIFEDFYIGIEYGLSQNAQANANSLFSGVSIGWQYYKTGQDLYLSMQYRYVPISLPSRKQSDSRILSESHGIGHIIEFSSSAVSSFRISSELTFMMEKDDPLVVGLQIGGGYRWAVVPTWSIIPQVLVGTDDDRKLSFSVASSFSF